jgi:ribosome-associated protein
MVHGPWTPDKIINYQLTYIIIRRIVYFCARMIEFKVNGDYIPLIQLLKAANLVQTGGEAQIVVTEGEVMYNGQVDYRKRLKVKPGDTVEFRGETIRVI